MDNHHLSNIKKLEKKKKKKNEKVWIHNLKYLKT